MKRIGFVSIAIESNAFAPVSTRKDFENTMYLAGENLTPHLTECFGGFGKRMDESIEWEPVPILSALGMAGGPCDHDFFEEMLALMEKHLCAALPLDGVFIGGHGAGTTTRIDDLDGAYFERIRSIVGPNIPIVAALDLHGNISNRMVAAADVQVSHRTNPHIDWDERTYEAAGIMLEMFAGCCPKVAFRRLPFVTAQVTQLTTLGEPLGDLVAFGQSFVDDEIMSVSILPGFAFSDTSYNGMSILVTARTNRNSAERAATEIAARAWSERSRFRRDLISIADAIDYAKHATVEAPIILADVCDNPGGGGRGNTVWLLEALLGSEITDTYLGVHWDPALVERAFAAGEGSKIVAKLNTNETHPFSKQIEVRGRIIKLAHGAFTGTRGVAKGERIRLGRCCLLEIEGNYLIAVSIRQQILSTEFFEYFGIDPAKARALVLKSRGHFRAGFDHLVPPERIFEVDAPGLTTANLSSVEWRRLPRPIYPLDPDTTYEPAALKG